MDEKPDIFDYLMSRSNYETLEKLAYRFRFSITSDEMVHVINHMYDILIQEHVPNQWDWDVVPRPVKPGLHGLVSQLYVPLKDINHDLLVTLLCEQLSINTSLENLLRKFVYTGEVPLLFELSKSMTVFCLENLSNNSDCKLKQLFFEYVIFVITHCLPLHNQMRFLDNENQVSEPLTLLFLQNIKLQIWKKREKVGNLMVYLKRQQLPFLSKDVWIKIFKMVLFGSYQTDQTEKELEIIENKMVIECSNGLFCLIKE